MLSCSWPGFSVVLRSLRHHNLRTQQAAELLSPGACNLPARPKVLRSCAGHFRQLLQGPLEHMDETELQHWMNVAACRAVIVASHALHRHLDAAAERVAAAEIPIQVRCLLLTTVIHLQIGAVSDAVCL